MSLPKQRTKEKLREFGIPEENLAEAVEWILDGHTDSTDALKNRIVELEKAVENLDSITKERDELKAALEKAGDAAKVQAEFDAFKKQVETEKTNASKAAAVKKLLRDSGVQRDTFLNLLMGKVDLDQIEMDGDALKDADGFVKTMREGYSDCFGTVETSGAGSSNPPSGGMTSGTGQTKDEILAIKDTAKRQQAIADNHELFGF